MQYGGCWPSSDKLFEFGDVFDRRLEVLAAWRCAASSLNPYPTKDSDVLRSGSCRVAGSRGFARPDCHGGDVCEERFGG